ncbi:MAG: hypothetical protein JWQ30_1429 [Sediminibacterium sp.]|nr:hypothetical protein [Sediminibacterium sp.]
MKRSVKIFSLILLLAGSVSAATLPADDYASEKTKSYTKTYALGSSDKVLLDNTFGEMKITTWNKNEIKVDVNITVKANSDDRAQKIMDMITIEDGKSGSEVFFKTHMKGDHNNRIDSDDDDGNRNHNKNHNNNDNSSTKINYTVYLPANATLNATNQFGPLDIGDYDGVVTLDCRFGTLTTGKLSQPKKITIQFGKATIESMNNGKLSVQFSRAQVNNLSGDIDASFNQSGGVKINVGNNIKKLDIHNDFGTVYLDADKNLSANFNIKTSFGRFSNETDFPVNKNRDDENRWVTTSSSYSGKAGSGSTPINIHNSFGTIKLVHDVQFDVNEKSKDRRDRERDNDKDKDKSDKNDKSDKKRTRV